MQGINSPNRDAQLTPVIEFVNDFVEQYCGISFSQGTRAGKKVSASGKRILLPDVPVTAVTKVTYLGNDLETTDYELDLDMSELYLNTAVVSQTENAYAVDYTYGYLTAPATIKLATLELVEYYDKDKHQGSKQLGNGQQVSYTSSRLLPPHIRNALDMYRRF